MDFPALSPSRSLQFPTNFVGKPKTQFRILLGNAPSGCKTRRRTLTSLSALNEQSTSFSVSRACTDENDQEPISLNNENDWVHFVGIGGSGLSALAMLALKQVKRSMSSSKLSTSLLRRWEPKKKKKFIVKRKDILLGWFCGSSKRVGIWEK